MANLDQKGFTLVELMIALAVMSMLSIIAFTGQASLRAQSQFDADANKLVASIAKAHDDASAGVNDVGTGTGTNEACKVSDTGQTVFAGIAFTANNGLVGANGSAFDVEYYKANPGQDACIYASQSISIPSGIQVVNASQGRELFVRTSNGGLDACPILSLATNVVPDFTSGVCATGTWTLQLTDASGHTSSIVVDPSGLAKRVN